MTKKKKQLRLDHESHWRPFKLDGTTYDLSHLDAHIVEFTQPKDKKNPERIYKFYITYSFHCFAKDYPTLTEQERKRLEYKTEKETRPFCFERYELSKNLPEIIKNIHTRYVFHGGYESFATCDIQQDGKDTQYFISFVAYREMKKLRLHIKSAYPLNEKLGKRKSVRFFNIALNLLRNKPLPKPQM